MPLQPCLTECCHAAHLQSPCFRYEFLVWGCEYLLKTIITGGSTKPATWAVVWQVHHRIC